MGPTGYGLCNIFSAVIQVGGGGGGHLKTYFDLQGGSLQGQIWLREGYTPLQDGDLFSHLDSQLAGIGTRMSGL